MEFCRLNLEHLLSVGQGEIARSVFAFLTEYESRWFFLASKTCRIAANRCKWADPVISHANVAEMGIESIIWHFDRYGIGVITLHYVADNRITLEMCDAAMRRYNNTIKVALRGVA